MVALNKFNAFMAALAAKQHDMGNDSFMLALTNVAPTAANAQLTDLTQIAYTYLVGRTLVVSASGQTGGVYKWVVNDFVLTASGGVVGPFEYVVIYNNTSANKLLVGWYDYGSALTLNDGDTLTVDFDNVNGVFQLQ